MGQSAVGTLPRRGRKIKFHTQGILPDLKGEFPSQDLLAYGSRRRWNDLDPRA
jgi:hypothetical protein